MNYPRVVFAGLRGDSGKTLATLAVINALRQQGNKVSAFKKGPDFIDAAWLGWAADGQGINLDVYLMEPEGVKNSFEENALTNGFNLIEGNRGVFDGMDSAGSYSTAELAKLLKSPVILVVDVTKVTRTVAAIVLGCLNLDPDVDIRGVILNNVATNRHQRVITESIEKYCPVKVVGAIPRLKRNLLPERHLGLVTPDEFANYQGLAQFLKTVSDNINLSQVKDIANSAPVIEFKRSKIDIVAKKEMVSREPVNVTIIRDRAFSFYYPENLQALESCGAKIKYISSFNQKLLPQNTDLLIIGGGFPELYLEEISKNHSLLGSIRDAVERGLPVYAECGGLIYLARQVEWNQCNYRMAQVLPIDMVGKSKPQGHGYSRLKVGEENPFFTKGTVFKGHEFHYTYITSSQDEVECAFQVERGKGCFPGQNRINGHDGLVRKNVFATYSHLHAKGAKNWASALVEKAYKNKL